MELGCVLWETRVGSRPGISNALLREAAPTHLGSGLRALGRSPAVLGLVFWLFLQTGDSASSVQSLAPAQRPSGCPLASLPRAQGALPSGPSAASAAPLPPSWRGGTREASGASRRSEGNQLGESLWIAAGAAGERIAGPQVISRPGHLLVCVGRLLRVPGMRDAGAPDTPLGVAAPSPDRSPLASPLELLGRQCL